MEVYSTLLWHLQKNIKLNEPEYDTFYLPMNEKGYTTYPFSEEFLKENPQAAL